MISERLGNIVDIQIGKTPSRYIADYWGGSFDWLSIADLNNLEDGKYISNSKEQITEKAIKETGCVQIERNTILFSFKLSIGKIAITKKTFYTNEAIAAFKIKNPELFNINYLFYLLKNIRISDFADHGAKGLTLNKKSLSSILIPIVDIKQQNKIVSQLDLLQSIITKRSKTIKILDEIINSIFIDIIGDPITNPKKNVKQPLKKIGNWQSGGTPPRKITKYFEGDINWYSSGELNEIYISKSKEKITLNAIRETSAKKIQAGSLLIGMYDTAALKSSITLTEASCNQAIAFAKLDEKLCDTIFVYYAIQLSKTYYLNQRLGARQQNLSVDLIKNMEIPLPKLELQKEFSKKAIQFLNFKKQLKNSLLILETLFKSFSEFAFREKGLDEIGEVKKYLDDIVLQQDLFGKIQTQDFQVYEEYLKAKKILFELLESKESIICQRLSKNKKRIEIQIL